MYTNIKKDVKLGKIIRVYAAKDVTVSAVDIETKHGVHKRPEAKLCLIEL